MHQQRALHALPCVTGPQPGMTAALIRMGLLLKQQWLCAPLRAHIPRMLRCPRRRAERWLHSPAGKGERLLRCVAAGQVRL